MHSARPPKWKYRTIEPPKGLTKRETIDPTAELNELDAVPIAAFDEESVAPIEEQVSPIAMVDRQPRFPFRRLQGRDHGGSLGWLSRSGSRR